jgi:hypothetical protein
MPRRNILRCHDAESDAVCALFNQAPKTMAGVLRLLQYSNAADTEEKVGLAI